MKTTLSIGILEDSYYYQTKITEAVKSICSNVEIRIFKKRAELEKAWIDGYRPHALILDLLVPDWLPNWVIIFFSGTVRGVIARRMRSLLRGRLQRWVEAKLTQHLEGIPENLMMGRDPYWGGIEFIRTRMLNNDRNGVHFYVYTIAANTEFLNLNPYGKPCKQIMLYFQKEVQQKVSIEVFAKDVFKGGIQGMGQLPELLQHLRTHVATGTT